MREQALPRDARLELFEQICAAVQYAHQHLIAHRDLEPANVLVSSADGSPRVKLLDFGIAKLLGGGIEGAARTTAGSARLTPANISPAQARGEPASAASDVYSLGAVLYVPRSATTANVCRRRACAERNLRMNACASLVLASFAAAWLAAPLRQTTQPPKDTELQLGNFSISLTVKDLAASQAFYEKLDFKRVGGDPAQNWVVLQNGATTIGLFQGMFERNMLTFNPGWNAKKETLKEFEDVRELQRKLVARGLEPKPAADENSSGPAFFMLTDPDGNPILVDQHVPRPVR